VDDNFMKIIIICLSAVLIVIIWAIMVRNRFVRLLVKINEADSGIEVALTKRYDTLVKMLDVTKGYAKHESVVLANTVRLRKGMSALERTQLSGQMDELTGRISILAENYPDLKASENFKQLQISVTEAEEHLQAARRLYNMNVSQFNQLLVAWPPNMIGWLMKLKTKDFFEAEKLKKDDVKLTF
jgi:LemA protein